MVIFNDFCWDFWTEMNWSGPQVKDSISYELRYTLVCLSLYYSCWLLSNFSTPNKSLQAFFLTGIDVVSQNCKTQKILLTLRIIPEQIQTPPERSFRTLLISISVLWKCYPCNIHYCPYWFECHGLWVHTICKSTKNNSRSWRREVYI